MTYEITMTSPREAALEVYCSAIELYERATDFLDEKLGVLESLVDYTMFSRGQQRGHKAKGRNGKGKKDWKPRNQKRMQRRNQKR